MNINQSIADVKASLAEVKARIESGEDGAVEEAAPLLKQLEDLERKRSEAEAFKAVLAGIGEGNSGPKPADAEARAGTLGERAASAVKAAGVSPVSRGCVVVDGVKAAGDPSKLPTGDAVSLVRETRAEWVEQPRRPLTVAALFGQEQTDMSAVSYFVETATVEGSVAAVAEGGAFPSITIGEPTKKTDALKKIGCIYRDTAELLNDGPRLAQSIDERAQYLMDIAEEDQLLSGDGTGNNITGLLSTSGIQTGTYADMDALVTKIKNAKVLIRKATPGFRADAILINDETWDELTNLRDSNNQFLAGGPWYGPYGNGGGQSEEPPLWGLRVVTSQAVAKGTVVVGAFRLGASVVRNGGRTVEVTNSDGTDFQKDLVAFKPSERLTLAVRYPAAFVKLTKTV